MKYELTDLTATLKAAREAKGLSQRELGQLVGAPQSHISKIENGRVDLRVTSLIEIARALDMELTIVPRRSLSAIKSIAQGTVHRPTETARNPTAIQKELKRVENTITNLIRKHPTNEQLAQFQRQTRELQRLRVPDSYLNAIRAAEKNLRSIERNTKSLGTIGETLLEFRNLRNTVAHIVSGAAEAEVSQPAYTLDDDHG